MMQKRLLLLISLLLTGCINKCPPKSKRDGAPHKHHIPNLDKIKDAVPQAEPLSKYGNKFGKGRTYVALNKRYTVLPTSKNYKVRGKASWYGTKFHGQRTSSGEVYDMFAMTAAHKTLPLPTYAKVTNLKNGKSIIVKINDRGPFHGDRVVDLSYVAAAKLGVVGDGTAHVELQSIDPRDHGAPVNNTLSIAANAALTQEKPLYLQLGAFSQKTNAEGLKAKLNNLSTHPIKITKAHPKKLYKVQIGPLNNVEEAKRLAEQIAKANLGAAVMVEAS